MEPTLKDLIMKAVDTEYNEFHQPSVAVESIRPRSSWQHILTNINTNKVTTLGVTMILKWNGILAPAKVDRTETSTKIVVELPTHRQGFAKLRKLGIEFLPNASQERQLKKN